MISDHTATIADPLARANVYDAFSGPGRPAGVERCEIRGSDVIVTYDDAVTPTQLIDDLIVIESTFVPARSGPIEDIDVAAGRAAQGLADPALDASRILETYLP